MVWMKPIPELEQIQPNGSVTPNNTSHQRRNALCCGAGQLLVVAPRQKATIQLNAHYCLTQSDSSTEEPAKPWKVER